jgi:hypothetical protein
MRRAANLSLFSISLAGLASAACAPGATGAGSIEAAGPRACFQADQVQNFRTDGAQTLYVRALDRTVYELNASGFCRGLDTATSIAISAQTGAGSRLCTGDWALIGGGLDPCRARVSRALTTEQLEALPSRHRP